MCNFVRRLTAAKFASKGADGLGYVVGLVESRQLGRVADDPGAETRGHMRPTVGLEGALAGLTISLPALLFISFTLNLQLLPHLPCASSCSGSCTCTYFFTYCSYSFPQVGPGLGRHARQGGQSAEAAASTGWVSCSSC